MSQRQHGTLITTRTTYQWFAETLTASGDGRGFRRSSSNEAESHNSLLYHHLGSCRSRLAALPNDANVAGTKRWYSGCENTEGTNVAFGPRRGNKQHILHPFCVHVGRLVNARHNPLVSRLGDTSCSLWSAQTCQECESAAELCKVTAAALCYSSTLPVFTGAKHHLRKLNNKKKKWVWRFMRGMIWDHLWFSRSN